MKSPKLLIIAAIGCMSVVFLSNPAYAQVDEIIADYCEEVDQNVTDTIEELENASADLAECGLDLSECLLGQGLFDDPSDCIKEYAQCIKAAKRDQAQACATFLKEFSKDTKRAEIDAEGDDVLEEFRAWYHGDSDARNECILPAEATLLTCADELQGG